MKEKILKIILKLVWFKKLFLGLRYWPVHDITQFLLLNLYLPSAVLSLTDYLNQKSILQKPWCLLYLLHAPFVIKQFQIRLWHVQNVLLKRATTSVFKLRAILHSVKRS